MLKVALPWKRLIGTDWICRSTLGHGTLVGYRPGSVRDETWCEPFFLSYPLGGRRPDSKETLDTLLISEGYYLC